MKMLAATLVSASLFCASGQGQMAPAGAVPPQTSPASITLPAGAKIELALIRPIRAQGAAPGSIVYGQTTFPVISGGRMAIPPGTYVQGILDKLTRPTRKTKRAELDMLFTKIVYANGYIVELPGSQPAQTKPSETLIAVTVQVIPANDILLDNGAPIEVTLAAPLALDAAEVAQAIPVSRAPNPAQFKSASLCRATPGSPGTPGTPDTVIPGSPGTPDTVIPGAPGMPDTVIPGTPATPDTVIPGIPDSPGSPGTSCPMSPIVISCALVAPANGQAQSPPPSPSSSR
ncbi:MAG: hypothetical protein ACRD3N_04085 [Terracidiphilus sp.]